RRRRLSQLTAHTARLVPEDVVVIEGLPVTSVARTTYELGRWLMDGEHRSRWVDHAVDEGLPTFSAACPLLGPSADDTLMYPPGAARRWCPRPPGPWPARFRSARAAASGGPRCLRSSRLPSSPGS